MQLLNRFSSKQRLIAGIGVAILLLAIISITLVKAKNRSIPVPVSTQTPDEYVDRNIPTPPPDLELPDPTSSTKSLKTATHVGVLLLGYGGAGHQGGFLSDVILIAYFDVATKKLALIHIPRDIWVNIPIGSTTIPSKINAALALGTKSGNYPTKDLPSDSVLRGAYLSKIAVKQITGLDIDYVIGIDFNGFKQAINALKGVDVNVSTTLNDPWYPVKGKELEFCDHTPEEVTALSATKSGFDLEKQFPCRYETLQVNPGINHMDGELALKFVRSRHSSSDFERGKRQMELLIAIKDKLLSLGTLDRIPEFFKSLTKSIKTDLSVTLVSDFAPVLKTLPQFKVIQFGLNTSNVLSLSTTPKGGSILIPKSGIDDWQATHAYIISELKK